MDKQGGLSGRLRFGAKGIALLLVVNAGWLSAEEERPKEKPKKVEAARPAQPAPHAGGGIRPAGEPQERRGPVLQMGGNRFGGEIHHPEAGVVRMPGGGVVTHSPAGVQRMELPRPGGRVVVAAGPGRIGYVQAPLVSHGQALVQRTYVRNGVVEARIYRPWSSGGRVYHIYTPTHYYRPAFYNWAYTPWTRPVYYRWGWSRSPWYGYYGGYFAPYPTYTSPAFWLTDFLIASTLESAYLSANVSMSAPPPSYDPSSGMTPEVKAAIADEVQRQMVQERADQAASIDTGQPAPPPAIFSAQGPRIFLVSSDLPVMAGGRESFLTEGDVIQMLAPPAPGSEWAQVRVMATRGTSCPRGSYVSIRTVDLQELANHFQATLDQGLGKLQEDQGSDGLPPAPARAMGTVDTPYAQDLRPDGSAATEISSSLREINPQDADSEDGPGLASDGAPSANTISLGMSVAQVEHALGQPRNVVDLGAKKIYVYKDLKVTFLNGRVSDVQ